MNWDQLDALTMVPGLVGTWVLAWMSNDFVYRISVLSWGWCCLCSIVYHLHNCDPKLLRYDLRAQWVSQVFMILETPQSSWPVLLGGLSPVGYKGRVFINGLGAFYFLWHSTLAKGLLLMSYLAYVVQFPFKIPWSHSIFHVLLHCAGAVPALSPVKKFSLSWIHPDWAWVVFGLGALILIPNSVVYECVDSVRRWASNLFYIRNSLTDLPERYLASRGPKPSCALSGTCDCTHEEQLDRVGSSVLTRGARSRRTSHPPARPNTPEPSGPDTPETSGPQPDPVQTPRPDRTDT
jgi:hypothetical protein